MPFFKSERQFNNFVNIENAIETFGADKDYVEDVDIERIDKTSPSNNTMTLDEGKLYEMSKMLTNYYLITNESSELYKFALSLEKDLEDKYLKKRSRQTKITEYLFKNKK